MTTLAELTTLRVGGPVAHLIEPATRADLVEATLGAWGGPDDWLILGGGSNLVVADEGFDGTVVRVATRGIERLPAEPPPRSDPEEQRMGGRDSAVGVEAVGVEADGVRARRMRLRIEAGEPWDSVVEHAVTNGWAGIEALSGIPGSSGAAPIQNIGAYGQELASSLVAIEFLDYASGVTVRLPAAELGLGYRTSELKRGRQGLVVALELALSDDERGLGQPIAYAQLATALGVRIGDRVPVADARRAVLALRASKGMLWDPTDPDSISAGSFFTNPIVSEGFARALPADAPRWPTAPEERPRILPLGSAVHSAPASGEYLVKLSAAWLIERSGIGKGFALPGSAAAISGKHTLAIVNRGGATAREIVQLAGYVQTRVLSEFGVILQPEPVLVGVQL